MRVNLFFTIAILYHLGACSSGTAQHGNTCDDSCDTNATCTQTGDRLACVCKDGYEGDGRTCLDIDECAVANKSCSAHASCTNTSGSFSCSCQEGFTGDGTSYCIPSRFTKLAVGNGTACGLGSDGGIYCWGFNFYGNLGDGTVVPHARPMQVGSATDWIDVEAGYYTVCGIRADHSMWCWGRGNFGQLGDGRGVSEYSPTKVTSDKPGIGWKAMSVGYEQLCGIHDDGSLACWGRDSVSGTNDTTPEPVDSNTDWTQVAVGSVRCGIRGDHGRLYCWGRSFSGQLGTGSSTSEIAPKEVNSDTWKTLSVGRYNTCGIRTDGTLHCWGDNIQAGTTLNYGNSPRQIGTASDWRAISISTTDIIGLRENGRAYGWGTNTRGQLTLTPRRDVAVPTPLDGDFSWSMLQVAGSHACGIAADQAYCWGSIGAGQIGDGRTVDLYRPTRIGTDQWTALSGGPGLCGLRNDGALMCWGDPALSADALGLGSTEPAWAPTRVGNARWSAVAGGLAIGGSRCGVREEGDLYCWGSNDFGQLGLSDTSAFPLSPVASEARSGTRWTKVAVAAHTCAIDTSAMLWCWGNNQSGGLGNGTISTTPNPMATAPLPGHWLHVEVLDGIFFDGTTQSTTCGLATDHTLWCWGFEHLDADMPHLVPVRIGSSGNWDSFSMGGTATSKNSGLTFCGVQQDGSLWCWGVTLGDGTENTSMTPIRVGDDHDWKSVSVGGEICAVKTNGTLWCWNEWNVPLGNGEIQYYEPDSLSPTQALVPTRIGVDSDWSSVMTSGSQADVSCAIKLDGSLWCWGVTAAPIPGWVTMPTPVR